MPVRVSGGASKVTVRRPRGTEARAEVSGGASQLVFDGQRLGAVGGRTVLASGGFADAADRYEIRFTGGASQVTVDDRLSRAAGRVATSGAGRMPPAPSACRLRRRRRGRCSAAG